MKIRKKSKFIGLIRISLAGLMAFGLAGASVHVPARANTPIRATSIEELKTLVSGVTVYEWGPDKAALQFLVSGPSGCTSSGGSTCAVYLKDSRGEWISSANIGAGKWFVRADLKAGLEVAFSNGSIVLMFGNFKTRAGDSAGSVPPSDFVEIKRVEFSKSNITDFQCNPLSKSISERQPLSAKQDLMDAIIWTGQEGNPDEWIGGADTGTQLDGVTQLSSTKKIQYGYPAQAGFVSEPFPQSGIYRTAYDDVRWAPVVLDCSVLATGVVEDFRPFRLGKDGVVMYFNVLEGFLPSDIWVTISSKTYQIKRSGRYVVPPGGLFNKCNAIVRDFGMGDVMCFVPKKAGTYTIGVTERYKGTGNLLIKCQSGYYAITCTTSRDKSVSAKATGKFKVAANGVVDGPDWWPFNHEWLN